MPITVDNNYVFLFNCTAAVRISTQCLPKHKDFICGLGSDAITCACPHAPPPHPRGSTSGFLSPWLAVFAGVLLPRVSLFLLAL